MQRLRPFVLPPNYVTQAYTSGGVSARFRGVDPAQQSSPEDWIASVTTRWGLAPAGLTRLPDGRLLASAIEEDPEGFLGPEHVARSGNDPGLLVKLLDAAERLVVHAHPDDAFASRHLGCAHGKTEAWIVIATAGDDEGEVFAGFTRTVSPAELAAWVAERSAHEMLACLHRIPVRAGAAVLVPAGVPHAVGAGVLILELQQPTDFSIMLERRSPDGGDLGLGWDLALEAVDRGAWSPARLAELMGPGTSAAGRVLPEIADPFFRADLVRATPGTRLEPGFAVAVGVAGSGELRGEFPGGPVPIGRGTTVLIPYGAGAVAVAGAVEIVLCRPAAPGGDPRPPRPEPRTG
jgi:mannose-6-phosphate isomerase